MRCPYCGFRGSRVIHLRPGQEQAILRHRKCGLCGSRFITQGSSRELFNERLRLLLIKKADAQGSKKVSESIKSPFKIKQPNQSNHRGSSFTATSVFGSEYKPVLRRVKKKS